MAYFLTGAALLLHTCWWGAGLALALTPRYWRRFWIIFMPICGLSLQAAVVWAGALLDLPGTVSYAWWSEVVPAGLLAWQLRRAGWRTVAPAWRRTAGLWILVAAVLASLLWPMARASRELTTLSIGSCDAADYAAGARLMQEFRRSDRSGFLGLTEVVKLHSVDDFYEHFTRLNHFAPSALVAHHAAVLGREVHELVGVVTAVLLASSLPIVFWLARAGLRLPSAAALLVASLYGLSPVTWYAVFHVAMGQLLAAQAVALLTIGGVTLWRRRGHPTRASGWFGLLAAGYGLVLAGYHFIIVVALVPVVAFTGAGLLQGRAMPILARWALRMGLPGAVASAFFWLRIDGLLERFALFETSNFGWPIRGISLEGWLGFVEATTFAPLAPLLRWPLLMLFLFLLAWTFRRWSWRSDRDWLAFSLTVPVLAGYGYLLVEGREPGSHESYNAYKLLSVFFPGILAVACAWLALWQSASRLRRGVVAGAAAAVMGAHVVGAATYIERASRPQLIVDRDLAALRQIETRTEVDSINVLLPDMWSRLWANAFLLRRPHYFAAPTYEGRQPTALRGTWDLTSGLIKVKGSGARSTSEAMPFGDRFELRRRGGEADLRVSWGPQWFDVERNPRTDTRWRWCGADAELLIDNQSGGARTVRLQLDAWSAVPRDVEVRQDGRPVGVAALGVTPQRVSYPGFVLAPGRTVLQLRSPTPAVRTSDADARELLLAVHQITFAIEVDPPQTAPTAAASRRTLTP